MIRSNKQLRISNHGIYMIKASPTANAIRRTVHKNRFMDLYVNIIIWRREREVDVLSSITKPARCIFLGAP